ncbi:unnamed protein product [Eruca vesicaria subsp. sativa]|uniref:Uncharacterized protein n=1 Tax=Eruca vesicaria subsp. sativa TaxID=29727 RepID=A0ABC8KVD0_ERUVS|nr:unnamed protein product [Eruca vesicaria subsp. sativa]
MATDQETLLSDGYVETATATFCGCGHLCNLRGLWNCNLQEEKGESWLSKKLKGPKEISEKIAGPKWKNFIRSFSNGRKKMKRDVDFTYDLKNYSLNFDDGGESTSPERYVTPAVIKV